MVNLAENAIKARELSYSPYSHFQVGAVLLCDDGHLFAGANIEIAGSSASCCAMRVALTSAISSGYHYLFFP
jgi:cytidine deaminase